MDRTAKGQNRALRKAYQELDKSKSKLNKLNDKLAAKMDKDTRKTEKDSFKVLGKAESAALKSLDNEAKAGKQMLKDWKAGSIGSINGVRKAALDSERSPFAKSGCRVVADFFAKLLNVSAKHAFVIALSAKSLNL